MSDAKAEEKKVETPAVATPEKHDEKKDQK